MIEWSFTKELLELVFNGIRSFATLGIFVAHLLWVRKQARLKEKEVKEKDADS